MNYRIFSAGQEWPINGTSAEAVVRIARRLLNRAPVGEVLEVYQGVSLIARLEIPWRCR